jgi:hypothetical protein
MAHSDENYDDIKKKILSKCAFMANIKTRKIITKTTTLINQTATGCNICHCRTRRNYSKFPTEIKSKHYGY